MAGVEEEPLRRPSLRSTVVSSVREGPLVDRWLAAARWIGFGATFVLMLVAFARPVPGVLLFGAMLVGALATGVGKVREAVTARAAWRGHRRVDVDIAALRDASGATVRRPPVLERRAPLAGAVAYALFGVGTALGIALDDDPSPWWQRATEGALVLAVAAALSALGVGLARQELIVTDDVVAMRTRRWTVVPWAEVTSVDVRPQDGAIVFSLGDERALAAPFTSRPQVPFWPVRYDAELLEELRARWRRAHPA